MTNSILDTTEAIEISKEKYCSVRAVLKHGAGVRTTCEIIDGMSAPIVKATRQKLARARARTPAHRTGSQNARQSLDSKNSHGTAGGRNWVEDDAESSDVKRRAVTERENSEIMEGLAERGQPFEAETLAGVEEAEDSDETEVATHEGLPTAFFLPNMTPSARR